jgi:hypothetical protein
VKGSFSYLADLQAVTAIQRAKSDFEVVIRGANIVNLLFDRVQHRRPPLPLLALSGHGKGRDRSPL